jgi:site-specific recombinase XerD
LVKGPKFPSLCQKRSIFRTPPWRLMRLPRSKILKRTREEWVSVRDAALLQLIYAAGLRISEALNLKVGDISDSLILKIKGKGGKERIVPLIAPVYKNLQELISCCPFCSDKNSYIFYGKQGKGWMPQCSKKLCARCVLIWACRKPPRHILSATALQRTCLKTAAT